MRGLAGIATFLFVLSALSLPTAATAAIPGEVAADASLVGDTLTWSAVTAATHYNVYRGTTPSLDDHACLVFRTTATSATLPASSPSTGLFYYLVSAVDGFDEGPLGYRDGFEVPNLAPCDPDRDGWRDDIDDNCPGLANSAQADQDDNGTGDPCDPRTYDFEADVPGSRPLEIEQFGGVDLSFTVRDVAGDLSATYDGTGPNGIHDRFARLPARMPHQDTTVYIDYEAVAEVLSIELWSDGTATWNAGTGLILQIDPGGTMILYLRDGGAVPSLVGPVAPPTGRIRVRLIKEAGTESTVHVDAWDGAGWRLDDVIFTVADDHRYRGLDTVLANWRGGLRALKRITIIHEQPRSTFVVRKHASWSSDWKVFQRDTSDLATIPVRFDYRLSEPGRVEARVVDSATRIALNGHDWSDHLTPVPVAVEGSGSIDVIDVPAGGNYDVEARLVRDRDDFVIGGGFLASVAVGEVFVCGGQSNMAGYSGGLAGAEPSVDRVHLFHNDGTWKRGTEPMDDGTDQVDKVSAEGPAHSLMLSFAKSIEAAVGVPVGIIPGPLGGTNLYAQWQRDPTDHANRGTLYGSLLSRALLQNYATPVKGFLWFQGESDVGVSDVAAYRADLEELIAWYREDLGNPGLYILNAQLGTFSGANLAIWLEVQEAERQVAVADPLVALVTTIDQPRADSIHFNVVGYREIGRRFGDAARELIYSEAIDASLDVIDARVGVAVGEVEITFDGPIVGGASVLFQVSDSIGAPVVLDVRAAGAVVTLVLDRSVALPATVSYGYSVDPAAAWVEDLNGVPVPCFLDLSISP